MLAMMHSCSPTFKVIVVRISPFARELAVRLGVDREGRGELVVREATGNGTVGLDKATTIPKSDVDAFLELLANAEFWSKATNEQADPNIVLHDADHWVLEGVENGTYHVVDRASPRSGPYADACVYLAHKLARLDRSIFVPQVPQR
jgi:hypothetical protein